MEYEPKVFKHELAERINMSIGAFASNRVLLKSLHQSVDPNFLELPPEERLMGLPMERQVLWQELMKEIGAPGRRSLRRLLGSLMRRYKNLGEVRLKTKKELMRCRYVGQAGAEFIDIAFEQQSNIIQFPDLDKAG